MIQVLHDGELVSTINFGWEQPAFYKQWIGLSDDDSIPQMHGASIDITSPNRVSAESALGLFHALLNEKWIEAFKRHYSAVKTRLASE